MQYFTQPAGNSRKKRKRKGLSLFSSLEELRRGNRDRVHCRACSSTAYKNALLCVQNMPQSRHGFQAGQEAAAEQR